jgi:gliding motility-associated-like protein
VQDANGCTFTTSATVAEAELDLVTSIRTRYEECAENGGTIEVLDVSGGTAPYLFSFGNGPFTSVTSLDGLNPGVGVIRVRDANNCEWSGSFSIPVPSADALVFAPNSFTPNGDGINDEWAISASCINEFECLIFDRWGQLISTLNAEDPQWDGTIFGQPAKPDLYVYLLNVKASFGSSDRYRGSIMLLR